MFITFEGGEGTGKTTQINILKKYLETKGFNVVCTREPGGIASAEQIREVILNNDIDPMTEALLYAAARSEHLVKKVIPLLHQGTIVICDRYLDSSIAYQGVARGLGFNTIININSFAIENCNPDLTILFEIDPKVALKRIHSNRLDEINRFDNEALDFHIKVQQGYQMLKSKFPNRIHSIDASKNIDEVSKQIIYLVEKHL